MRYAYAGPGPHEDPELGLVHPGDEHEFGEEPAWGPWLLLDEPEAPAAGSGTPPPPLSPPPADPEPPVTEPDGGM